MSAPDGKISVPAWMVAAETQKVMSALTDDGGDARFVGGCVRDTLANRRVVDIDIATPLLPKEVIARLEKNKISFVPTGLAHGTVTAIVDGKPFEITTLRRDVATDGRHAEVAFTDDWREDAARRDFTFNAIFATLDGDIFDPFGGIEDLRRGRVRFVGAPEQRIAEDYLRILRFFRFHAHFGQGDADAKALAACAQAATHIAELSAERIRQEILKLLEAKNCAPVWQMMIDQGIIRHALPEATNAEALARLVDMEEKYETEPSALRRLAALIGEAKTAPITEKLRLSRQQTARLSSMRMDKAELQDAASIRRAVYRHGNDAVRNALLLAAPLNMQELYHEATVFRAQSLPVEGEDVLALGIASGPRVGEILNAVEDWWISQDFAPNRATCLQKLATLI